MEQTMTVEPTPGKNEQQLPPAYLRAVPAWGASVEHPSELTVANMPPELREVISFDSKEPEKVEQTNAVLRFLLDIVTQAMPMFDPADAHKVRAIIVEDEYQLLRLALYWELTHPETTHKWFGAQLQMWMHTQQSRWEEVALQRGFNQQMNRIIKPGDSEYQDPATIQSGHARRGTGRGR